MMTRCAKAVSAIVGRIRGANAAGLILLTFAAAGGAPGQEGSAARIADISEIQGVRSNQLTGYGLVVGLAGSGDSRNAQFTVQSIANMLSKFGVQLSATRMQVKNVAAVMVTCDLPAYVREGTRLDVTVSSIGDSKSLQGGMLVQTPLLAANGEVYAVAQGSVSIGGFNYGGGGAEILKNHALVGRVPGGAIVEKDVPVTLLADDTIKILLDAPNFTTAARVEEAINSSLAGLTAHADDAGTVSVSMDAELLDNIVPVISDIQNLPVLPAQDAKIVINERTGSIVIGSGVKVRPCAVAHGNIYISVTTREEVIQPTGDVLVNPEPGVQTNVRVEGTEEKSRVNPIPAASTVGEIAEALNALGVTPRDLIAILQEMKQQGAIVAKIEIQ
jgi:flagellar P-ring protein precursor FlgI